MSNPDLLALGIASFSAIISLIAVIITIIIYLLNRNLNRKLLAYQMLLEVNNATIEHPDIRINNEEKLKKFKENERILIDERKTAYYSVAWNFVEGVYQLKLTKEEYLEPSLKSIIYDDFHYQWFKTNPEQYSLDFIKYVKGIRTNKDKK